MNKTVTANISGVVFHIETDAYEKLHQYLNTIRNYFVDSDGTDEIMADIEARIAELFKEILDEGKDVITMVNVQKVIGIMGEPEQYMDEEPSSEYTHQQYTRNNNTKSKKLYRDPDDNILGGVCSGLGHYFGIDRIWLRAAFLIAVIAGFGTGFIVYLILWIIVPSAKNTAEKLEMKGEPINVQNIGNTIKDEFDSFKKKVNNNQTRQYGQKAENAAFKFFDALGNILSLFFKFFGKIIGVAFIVLATIGIITLLVGMVSGPFNLEVNNLNYNNWWTTDIAEVFFSSTQMFYIGLIGLFLVTVLPLLGLLYGGLKLLFKVPSSGKAVTISAISLFTVGVILICVSITTTVAQYSNQQKKTETIVIEDLPSDTLMVSSLENTYSTNLFGSDELFIENDQILSNEIHFDVIQSRSEFIELRLLKSSKGRNRKDAGRRAENTTMTYELSDNMLRISPLITVPFEDRYRDQEIKLSIALPVGKSIYLDPSSREIIYDIENVTNTHDNNMTGHYWKMTTRGLECTDCPWSEEEEEAIEEGIEIEEEIIN